MKLILLSKYFTPDKSVDATSSTELIKELKLINRDIEIHVVTSSNNYKNHQSISPSSQQPTDNIHLHRVSSFYSGTNKIFILIGAIIDGLRMTLKARNIPINSIITLTNPPLISFWYALLLKKKRWIYWTFDLYPEALSASGILSKKSLLYRYFDNQVYKTAPSCLISLGAQQKNFLLEKYKTTIPSVILPCGILSKEELEPEHYPSWYSRDKDYIGYIGNVGKAHSKEFLMKALKSLKSLPPSYLFVLSIYGEHKNEIENYVVSQQIINVIIVQHIEARHLQLIDVHLVSLLNEWTHVSVPSKAVSAVCSGSCLCFYGSTESDTWNMFKDCSFLITNFDDLSSTFSSLNKQLIESKKQVSQLISKKLLIDQKQAFRNIYSNLIE